MNLVRKKANPEFPETNHTEGNAQSHQRHRLFGETRTRILVWYSVLMFGFLSISIPLFSQLVLLEVNVRVREELNREFDAFDKFMKYNQKLANSTEEKRIKDLFKEFLYYNIPEDDNFLITILDGHFYRSSPRALPAIIGKDSAVMKHWQTLTYQIQGEQNTSDPSIGKILYIAKPVIKEGKVRGIFIVAHITAGEIKEATDIIAIFTQLSVVVILVALMFAWMVSAKV